MKTKHNRLINKETVKAHTLLCMINSPKDIEHRDVWLDDVQSRPIE